MNKCFVIQPFDNDKFDRRFKESYEPAIIKADLEPYRIDKDLSVRILIDEIEKRIQESEMCFADITTDNPNVWYELGFAFACNRDVVMICSDERIGKFPFDIQHRHIITYKTGSKSDFETLEDTITRKIVAIRQSSQTTDILYNTPVVETEGLKSHEIALLVLITSNNLTSDQSLSVFILKSEMNKSGYTDIATSVGLKSLFRRGLILLGTEQDEIFNESYPVVKLTENGENWILINQDQLVYRIDKPIINQEEDNKPF